MRNEPVNEQLGEFWDPAKDEILSLRTYELQSLARTCRFFHSKIKEELTRRKPMIHAFVRQVVCGEEAAAKASLDIDPSLLLWEAGEATDYSGRQIKNLTPFQAALCAGDADMIEMMLPYFDLVPNGQAAMKAQFAEIFPDAEGGLEGHFKRQKEAVFDFSEITAAIDAAKDKPTELLNALDKVGASFREEASEKPRDQWTLTERLNGFREKFTKKSHAEVVFNPEHLLKAFRIYKEKFGGWNWGQRDLFWRQVIGFVQRFLPAGDAQAVAQGIFPLTEKNEMLRRSFDFKVGGGRFYPVDFNSCSYLGFDYACIARPLWPSVLQRCPLDDKGLMVTFVFLQNLYRIKTRSLENLCNSACRSRPVA